jgi:hypothetical protein
MSSNIEVKLDVLNQKGSPALFASSLATRPAASFQGRLFVDSDNPSTGIYRDTGSTWVQIADAGAGTSGTLQQVTTNGNTSNVGIQITAGGLSSNIVTIATNGLGSTSNYIGQTMANNDNWKIFGYATTIDQGEMVFQVGDNGFPYASNGQRFRFSYDATLNPPEVSKDVFIIDYNLSYFNTNLGINTPTPSSPFDVHTATGINATFNGTGITNSTLQFQLAGIGKWNIGNLYNSASNDFIITDVTNTLNRITVKNTGQVFIGADTTSSGALIVNNSTSDNHIVCIGANAPSIRLRNTGTAPTFNAGLGISTATNNFIQGSASGNYCIYNSSTTASPILFGIYDAGTTNTQEAVRISASRNLLVGTVTDSGQKLIVNGSSYLNGIVNIGSTGGVVNLFVTDSANTFSTHISGNNQTNGIAIGTNASNVAVIQGYTKTFSAVNNISLQASGGNLLIGTSTNGSSKLRIVGLPTSSVGLSSGDVYSNAGILTIVP